MTGKFKFQKWITRDDLRDNPNTIYVFGDNMECVGMGGQAGAMRGEINSFGIPTKWKPSMENMAFFTDKRISDTTAQIGVINFLFNKLEEHLKFGRNVVFPEDGIGTGLSELPERAPKMNELIETKIKNLVIMYGE